jgi:hypothetical protein
MSLLNAVTSSTHMKGTHRPILMSQDSIETLRTSRYGNENRSWRHPITWTSLQGNTAGLSTLCLLSFGSSVTSPYNAPWLMHESRALTLKCLYSRVCYNGWSYNELMLNRTHLSIKSGCYNERGGILLANVARACVWRVGPSCFD